MTAYMDTDQAARYLGFIRQDGSADRARLREYLRRYKVPTWRRGRSVVVRQQDLDASLRPGPVPAEHYYRRAAERLRSVPGGLR